MRLLLALVLSAACSGTSGVRDHAEGQVATTHCQGHECPTTPQPRNIGEGCYVVDDSLYQCSTDELPAGEVSCFEIKHGAGHRTFIKKDYRGKEISTERCRDLWRSDRDARRPPPTCSPVRLMTTVGSTTSGSALTVPAEVVLEVIHSGKTRLMYQADVCATDDGVVVGDAVRATGFAEFDRVLRGEIAEVAPPPGECVTVALIATDFGCELEVESM